MGNEIKIRFAKTEDAAALVEIYKPYVLETAISFEYDVPSVAEFAGRIQNIQKKYPYLVAEIDGEIVGYAYAHSFIERAAYDWSVEMTIYVAEEKKKHGIGKKLYDMLESILIEMNIYNLNACIGYTEVEDEYLTNNSMEFHEHLGYRLVGKFEKSGYKFGKWYDMIWMEKLIGERLDCPPRVKNMDEILVSFRFLNQ